MAFLPGVSAVARNASPAFKGKTLTGWHSQGSASWRSDNGEVVGKVGPDGSGGWLVLDTSYEQVGMDFWFRCGSDSETGVLLGMETAGNQTTGTYISLSPNDLGVYHLTIDSQGREVSRQKPPAAPPASGGLAESIVGAPVPFPPPLGHPMATPLIAHVSTTEWNHVELHSVSGSLGIFVNGLRVSTVPGITGGKSWTHDNPASRYGPVAIRVAGKAGAEIRLRDATISDYTEQAQPPDKLSSRFRMQQLNAFQFGDGMGVVDINRDGILDLVSGPMYYLGPDYRVGHEIEEARPFSPIDYRAYQPLGLVVADFTGDGWPDVLMTHWPAGLPGYLYVNPRGERRRWSRYKVISAMDCEFFALTDLNGDGKLEFVYGEKGYLNVAKPNPANPTAPWPTHHLTGIGPWGQLYAHGLGVGDINGDGRIDLLSAWGWWEHPANENDLPWKYHPVAFGRAGNTTGGGQMYVYDVNGDGLPDVVSSLEGHSLGLAWFEQKRSSSGDISFERHMIMDDDPAKSHGVVFGQLHSLAVADVDGDGLMDLVTGTNKYNWANNEYQLPESDSDGVVYWFKLVRKPGGAVEFLPQLVYNNSGMGRQIQAVDLNKDGAVDIMTNGKRGTYIFWGKKGGADAVLNSVAQH